MNKKQDMEDILSRSSLKENPFGVPEGYFESMQQEILEKISAVPVNVPEMGEPESEPVTLFTYLKPAIALASVFAIVFGIGYGTMKLTGAGNSGDVPLLQADSTPVESVAETDGTELTEEDFLTIIGDSYEELFAREQTDSYVEILPVEINVEEIEQYLIDSRVTTTILASVE